MKILFPSVFYLPQAVGGIEYYIHNLAKGLVAKGHSLKVVVPAFEDYDHNMKDYEIDGLQVIRYTGCGPANKLEIAGVEPNRSLDNFKEVLEREKPDIIHFSQLTNSGGLSLHHILAAKQSGAKVFYTNHLSEFICQRGDLRYMGAADCNGKITVTKCTGCMLQKRGLKKTAARLISHGDNIVSVFFGKTNFKRQLQPVTFPGFSSRWQIHKIESVINMADAFVSIADWSSNLLKKNGWHKSNCVTIKTGLFRNITIEKNNVPYDGKRPLRIIYMGRIVPVKALAVLINAVSKINRSQVELNVYGPKGHLGYSTYFDHCVELAAGAGNIFFHDPVDNANVVKLMGEHDLLCLPSEGVEMAPLVIQEAMAAGIPVIGSSLPAIKEWITDMHNGLIFSVGDADSLAKKLQDVINNPQIIGQLKKNILTPRDFESVVDEYEKLYQSFFNDK